MIEPYVLLNAADEGIAQDYPGYREKNREKLEQYLSEFVVPAAGKTLIEFCAQGCESSCRSG
jgi:hypothetical protein